MIELSSIGQVLGFVSFGLGISTFYQKSDRRLKILMLVLNVNHLLHYLLLGSFVSALAAALSALRTTAAIYTHSKRVALLFIATSIILGAMVAEDLTHIWPLLGTIIGTYSVFVLKGVAMRLGFLVGGFCWMTNNLLVGSIGGTLLEVTLLVTNMITIYRLLQDNKRRQEDKATVL